MVTYLYGLVLARNVDRVPVAAGLGGAAVRSVRCGTLGALVSSVEQKPARPTLEDVRTHDAVLQSAVDAGVTAVAVRFGQTFAGDDEMCRHTTERHEPLARLLEQYDGAVEMRLLLPAADDEPPPQLEKDIGPGRAYLESLRESREHADHLGLRGAIGPSVRAEKVERLPRSRGVVFAHLVMRDELQDYREAISLLPSLADAKVVGPLALYSFAETTS